MTITEKWSVGDVLYVASASDSDTAAPFNIVSYSMIGDDRALIYFNVSANGTVFIINNLQTAPGSETVYTVRCC